MPISRRCASQTSGVAALHPSAVAPLCILVLLLAALLPSSANAVSPSTTDKPPVADKARAVEKKAVDKGADNKGASADALTARIAELIEQLGDPQYVVRERAQGELQRIGPPALDALTKALEHQDVEVAMRARYLLGAIKVQWTDEKDPPPIRALMKNYDEQNEDGRLETTLKLAQSGGVAEVEVLCRIVRYERSHLLSKRAALLIVGLPEPTGAATWPNRVATITAGLGGTNRAGAEWVRTYLRHHNNVEQSLTDWQHLVEAEQQTLKKNPRFTSPEIVGELLRREIEMFEQLGRNEEAIRAMHALVPLESGQPKSVSRLVQWLAGKKAWDVIEEAAVRFGPAFDQDPLMLYTLAEARLALGKDLSAREVAAKALNLGGNELIEHVRTALELEKRGLHRWAEREFRRVIAIGPPRHELVLQSYWLMAEMFHDQQQDQLAGKTLNELVVLMDSEPELAQVLRAIRREPGSIRARTLYFLSEHERIQGNIARQIELLDKAVLNDATDADALIAMYRLPNQTDSRREQTLRRIKAAADAFRRDIQQKPESPTNYNYLAWLLGNTLAEKDPALADEAIQASLKSLELAPGAGGFLDTLGRCYYAKGDYEAAVRHQTEAARLEPHSGLIRRQLEFFQKALAESRKKKSAAAPTPKS